MKMDTNRIEVELHIHKQNRCMHIELPICITANELVVALNEGCNLGINTEDITNCYIKAENPIVLLKGNKTVGEYGLRNGSVIHFTA